MHKILEKPMNKNIGVVLCKKRSKKHQIFEKYNNFENRPACKGYRPCKGCSLCKMLSLGQKLKMPKICKKPFYKNIRVVSCKKALGKNTKYSRIETILKIGHLAKAIAHATVVAFAKSLLWVKKIENAKNMRKTPLQER